MPPYKDKRCSGIKQSYARKKKFSHDQYWSVSYTEVYQDLPERDYRTIIKARSTVLALEILESRLQENKGFKKVRSVTYSLIHEWWQISTLRRKLSVGEWESIRHVSFPNDWNRIFKFEKKRTKGQTNRFNVPPTVLSPEHKEKLRKAATQLVDDYVRGTFKPMCPRLRAECTTKSYSKVYGQRTGFASLKNPDHVKRELTYLKKLMSDCSGNIQYAADTAGVRRTPFYRALSRFPEVDWHKEFPLTYVRTSPINSMHKPGVAQKLSQTLKRMGHRPPRNIKGTKNYNKWKKKILATWARKRKELQEEWKAKLIPILRAHDHNRQESAEALGVTVSHMVRVMSNICKKDPAFKKEFMSPELSMRLKKAACRETVRRHRLEYLKENKHLILQAYYQNGETDYKAARVLKMDTRTFAKAREEIEKYEV